MADADAGSSWQQCYSWCTPYSHPHSHHYHTTPQYQGNQYQQLLGSASAAANPPTHFSSPQQQQQQQQQQHLQMQTAQPLPLDQQHQLHSIGRQTGSRRSVPYDGLGRSRSRAMSNDVHFARKSRKARKAQRFDRAARMSDRQER